MHGIKTCQVEISHGYSNLLEKGRREWPVTAFRQVSSHTLQIIRETKTL